MIGDGSAAINVGVIPNPRISTKKMHRPINDWFFFIVDSPLAVADNQLSILPRATTHDSDGFIPKRILQLFALD
jgi:hypothetical protein